MSRSTFKLSILVAALASLGACTADDPVNRDDQNDKPDAGSTADLPPPEVNVPMQTPEDTVAVRGTTEGTRVVIRSQASDAIIASVLPGGAYCRDVPLVGGEANALSVYALGGDGRVSAPAAVEVVHDAQATPPADATCSGMDMSNCAPEEVCGNDADDDCNGTADNCDLACSGCVDDVYEPNDDPVRVPALDPGSYELRICPCHDDWFSFRADMGDTIHVLAEFADSEIDLDLILHRAGPEGNGAADTVAQSRTIDDNEEITHEVAEAGLFYLRAFAYPESSQGSGDYTLTIY